MEYCWTFLDDISYLLEHVISVAFYPTSVTHRKHCFINSASYSDNGTEKLCALYGGQ